MTSSGKKSDPTQSKRFIETARELGCDEDEAAFEEKLKQIATAKPRRQAPRKRPPKKDLEKL
jgi:hypothetical protein